MLNRNDISPTKIPYIKSNQKIKNLKYNMKSHINNKYYHHLPQLCLICHRRPQITSVPNYILISNIEFC